MPDWLTTNRARPWHHVGHRVLRPFADPDVTPGVQAGYVSWCRHCQQFETGRKEGRFEGSVYALKEWCQRCGKVIRFAVYNQSGDAAMGQKARVWAVADEEVGNA